MEILLSTTKQCSARVSVLCYCSPPLLSDLLHNSLIRIIEFNSMFLQCPQDVAVCQVSLLKSTTWKIWLQLGSNLRGNFIFKCILLWTCVLLNNSMLSVYFQRWKLGVTAFCSLFVEEEGLDVLCFWGGHMSPVTGWLKKWKRKMACESVWLIFWRHNNAAHAHAG